jgi:hypothetical protein
MESTKKITKILNKPNGKVVWLFLFINPLICYNEPKLKQLNKNI